MTETTRQSNRELAADLFKVAGKMRGSLEPSEYKHIALGLIFLKYISDTFDAQAETLAEDERDEPDPTNESLKGVLPKN